MTFKVELRGDTYELSGTLDEHADLRQLLDKPRPLKLDLSKLVSVNSLGIVVYVSFLKAYGDGPLELHACPPFMVDCFNMNAAALGTPPRPERVRSILLSNRCLSCGKEHPELLPAADFAEFAARFPTKVCGKCGETIVGPDLPEDMFLFLSC